MLEDLKDIYQEQKKLNQGFATQVDGYSTPILKLIDEYKKVLMTDAEKIKKARLLILKIDQICNVLGYAKRDSFRSHLTWMRLASKGPTKTRMRLASRGPRNNMNG